MEWTRIEWYWESISASEGLVGPQSILPYYPVIFDSVFKKIINISSKIDGSVKGKLNKYYFSVSKTPTGTEKKKKTIFIGSYFHFKNSPERCFCSSKKYYFRTKKFSKKFRIFWMVCELKILVCETHLLSHNLFE